MPGCLTRIKGDVNVSQAKPGQTMAADDFFERIWESKNRILLKGTGAPQKVTRYVGCRTHDPAVSIARMPWKWPGIGGVGGPEKTISRETRKLYNK